MASQEFRMQEVNEQADKLVNEGHPEKETIVKRKEVKHFCKYLKTEFCITEVYICLIQSLLVISSYL